MSSSERYGSVVIHTPSTGDQIVIPGIERGQLRRCLALAHGESAGSLLLISVHGIYIQVPVRLLGTVYFEIQGEEKELIWQKST